MEIVRETYHGKRMKSGAQSISADIEVGRDGTKARVSAEAPTEAEYFYDFLPCMYARPELSTSPSAIGMPNRNSERTYETTPPPSVLGLSTSESMIGLTKTESCAEGSPPPMVVAASTSETDDDDEVTEQEKVSHTDPFAPRVGKTLSWRNVNMTLVGGDGCMGELLISFSDRISHASHIPCVVGWQG